TNTIYYHHNDGAGVVAGPLGQSITTAQPYLDPGYASLPTIAALPPTAMAFVRLPAPRAPTRSWRRPAPRWSRRPAARA
ncbi:hypothetical protein, partial [Klebsiella aerogenes]|uniref:hypothetical protein n=1 Tax=Klebsiella aerogenes TaxID=548 RepID=UPI001954B5AA